MTDVEVFTNKSKDWGYRDDAKPTTHAIVSEVRDTNRPVSIFDGITYSKGFSVLRQFYHIVGHERFAENMRNYFGEFQWRNARTPDLIRHLANGVAELDVPEWFESWIETSGTNRVRARWDPSAQGSQTMALLQSPLLPKHDRLRVHYLELAFFDADAAVATSTRVILKDQSETQVPIDNQGFRAVLPNSSDCGFIRVDLDDHSAEFLAANLWKVQSKLHVMMVLKILQRRAGDGRMPYAAFCGVCLKLLTSRVSWLEVVV